MDSQQAFDRKRTKQQRWNRQDNHSSQRRSRDSSRRQEGPPHRPGPSRKRDDRSRVREGNPRQYHLQRPRPDPEDPRDNPGHEIRQPLAPPKQPRPCERRGRTLKHARPRVHPQRSISTNQARLRQHHHRLPPEHRTAHTQRASNLGLSTDTSPVRVLSHGRTPNTRQSNGPCQVSTEGAVRLPHRPNNVRRQNSTLTASTVSSLEQFRRESTQDRHSKIGPHGRSTQQRTPRRHIQTKEPGLRTLQSTHKRTVQSPTVSRSIDQPTATSRPPHPFFTLSSEKQPSENQRKTDSGLREILVDYDASLVRTVSAKKLSIRSFASLWYSWEALFFGLKIIPGWPWLGASAIRIDRGMTFFSTWSPNFSLISR